MKLRFLAFFRRFHPTNGDVGSGKSVPPTIQSTHNRFFEYRWLRTEVSKLLLPTLRMALFRFGHAQKNAFASLIALTLCQIAIGLRSLNFRLPVARDHGDCFLSILRIACHTRLKRKELQTAQQKLSERQRRGIHVKAWGNAPGLRKSENISAESAIHLRLNSMRQYANCPKPFSIVCRRALRLRIELRKLNRAFSAWPSGGQSNSWGVARRLELTWRLWRVRSVALQSAGSKATLTGG